MDYEKKGGSRYPLKQKPLRTPGESLNEEIERLLDEQVIAPALIALSAVLFAAVEWLLWFVKSPPQPVAVSLMALAAVGYASYKFFSLRRRIKALQLGLEGEKDVGQYLEELRSKGYRIFHDVLGDNFNIDHVVVSPHGVFAIETKTYSKPLRGQPLVQYDGERILVNAVEPDRNAVQQALAQSHWLRDLLSETTGKQYPVKGVIVFPGWYVEPAKGKRRDDIWVLNPKALPSFIENEPVLLKPEDVALASSRLTIHITR